MKNYRLLALLCLLGLFLASCDEKKETEWENYYGYTNDDIIGTYSYSNVSDAFDGVEGLGRYHCEDAEISITRYSTSQVKFNFNSPSQSFSHAFTGVPSPNDDDFMVHMSSGYKPYGNGKLRAYNLTGYVLKNAKQQMRMHGFAAVNIYRIVSYDNGGIDTIPDNGTYYYFDVIKD